MQLIKLSAGMGHAGNFCYPALLEALFITAVVIGDELALPIRQEGSGMSTCSAWGKVVNDGIELFMNRRSIGPEVRAMCLSVLVGAQHLDGSFIRMQDMFLQHFFSQGIDQGLQLITALTHPIGQRGDGQGNAFTGKPLLLTIKG